MSVWGRGKKVRSWVVAVLTNKNHWTNYLKIPWFIYPRWLLQICSINSIYVFVEKKLKWHSTQKAPQQKDFLGTNSLNIQFYHQQLVGGFSPTHLKNMLVKLEIFRKWRKKYNIWNHHQKKVTNLIVKYPKPSIGMLNLPTCMVDLYILHGIKVGKYTSPMDPMGYNQFTP